MKRKKGKKKEKGNWKKSQWFTHTFLHLSNFSWSHFSEFPAYICDFTCNFRSTNREHRPTLQRNQWLSMLKIKYFQKSYICNPVKRCIIKIIGRRRSGRGIHRVTKSLISSTLRWRQISEKTRKINFKQKLKNHLKSLTFPTQLLVIFGAKIPILKKWAGLHLNDKVDFWRENSNSFTLIFFCEKWPKSFL